ncbi:MAG: hypothetical protein H6712_27815 [Myxococcales bacterium]|nr:hypothetical protein [Myxococcales bacterium]MCB9717687.1 hypothetical protein [Myxococcales bacterium]
MRKILLASLLGLPFAFTVSTPAHAAEPAATNPRVEDLQEWRQAWQGLSADDRETLQQAWGRAADALRGLTPEQRQQLRAATRDFLKRLSQRYAELDDAQKQALADAYQRWVAAYRALDASDKQAALHRLAEAIDGLQSASAEAKARLHAMVDSLG